MNKGMYRLIFNKARGLLMVVGEWVSSHGKSTNGGALGTGLIGAVRPMPSRKTQKNLRFRLLTFALLAVSGNVLFIHNVNAQVLADPSAPQTQQATVLSTANGVTQVNIQTPSAAGVSRNQYRQFDVNSRGVILNNSRTNATTQLGGIVTANPHLATGTASVIVNEINSSNPSRLNGFVEVAGSRANVVFANPSGITCSGCGFINANQATLTTGTPIYRNGHLDSFRVEGGTVEVNGAGLDGSSTDFTHIIARSVKVNAGIWADDLAVTAGQNVVSATTAAVTEIDAGGASPSYAIDVSSLGGMYAGKIRLVGTEDGVGVRNAGSIGAGVGGFTLSADGRITNTGSINSQANIAITANTRGANTSGIENQGTVYAGNNVTINTQSTVHQSGTIAAYNNVTLDADGTDDIDLEGDLIALDDIRLTADDITLTDHNSSADSITVTARENARLSSGALQANQLTVQAKTIAITDDRHSLNQATLTATTGDIDLSESTLSVSGTLNVSTTQALTTDKASVTANQLNITANRLSNKEGELLQSGTTALTLDLQGGLDNTDGRIETNSALTLTTPTLNNTDGRIAAADTHRITTTQALTNTRGDIIGVKALAIHSGPLNNDQGLIQGGDSVAIDTTTHALTNTNSGTTAGIISGGDLTIKAATFTNDAGYTGANNDLVLTTSGSSSNQAGVIESQRLVTIDTQALNNDQGRIQANTDLSIQTHGQRLTNTNSGGNGGLIASGRLMRVISVRLIPSP